MLSAAAGGVLGCKESLDLRDTATNSLHLAYEAFCTWMLVPGQASALVVPDARQDSRCCLGACLCLP